jgi:hypothetical protein
MGALIIFFCELQEEKKMKDGKMENRRIEVIKVLTYFVEELEPVLREECLCRVTPDYS